MTDPACPDCGCTSFEPHLFKKTICRTCMHPHSNTPVVVAKSGLPAVNPRYSTTLPTPNTQTPATASSSTTPTSSPSTAPRPFPRPSEILSQQPQSSQQPSSSSSSRTQPASSSSSSSGQNAPLLVRPRPSPSVPVPYEPQEDSISSGSSSVIRRPPRPPTKPTILTTSSPSTPTPPTPSTSSTSSTSTSTSSTSSTNPPSRPPPTRVLSLFPQDFKDAVSASQPTNIPAPASSNPSTVASPPNSSSAVPSSTQGFRQPGSNSILSLPPSSRTAKRNRGAMTIRETTAGPAPSTSSSAATSSSSSGSAFSSFSSPLNNIINTLNLNLPASFSNLSPNAPPSYGPISPKGSFSNFLGVKDDLDDESVLRWDIEPPSTEKLMEILHCLLLTLELDSDSIEKVRKVLDARKKKPPNPAVIVPQLKKVIKKSTDIVRGQEDIQAVTLVQAAIRAFICQRRYARIRQNFTEASYKRLLLFRELLKKEYQYVTNLRHIVQDYQGPLLKSSGSGRGGLSTKDIQAIFGNIQDILEVHNTFYLKLNNLKELNWPFISDLGLLFASTLPQYQCYGPYVHNFKFAMDNLDILESKDKGMALLDECTSRFDKSGASSLRMLLSQPLNHITSYELILEEYISLTPPGEPDHLELFQVVEVIRETSAYIRDSLAQADNKANFLSIQSRLKKFDGELYHSKRDYVTEGGSGVILYESNKKQGPGYFFVFSDIVVIAKTLSKGYEFKLMIFFRDAEVREVSDSANEGLQTCGIELVDPHHSCQICFADPIDKSNWVTLFRKLISENQVNRVYGLSLEEMFQSSDKVTKDRDYTIPTVVFKLIEYIRLNAMDVEGIFRVSGNASKISAIKQAFDKGTAPDYQSLTPHDIASALKLYFRELPEPLLTYRLYTKILEIMDADYRKDRKAIANQILQELTAIPASNLGILKYLLLFLNEVSKHESNMMKEENLSICWGPTVFRPKEETIDYPLQVPKINTAFQLLLENTRSILNLNSK